MSMNKHLDKNVSLGLETFDEFSGSNREQFDTFMEEMDVDSSYDDVSEWEYII